MTHEADSLPDPLWHTGDLLKQLAGGERGERGETYTKASEPYDGASAEPTLGLIAGSPERHERLAVQRSAAWVDRTLVVFGARSGSVWALDALAGRYTQFAHDWSTLRSAIMRRRQMPGDRIATVDEISLDRLCSMVELLHERRLDVEAEEALLHIIAERVTSGAALDEKLLAPLVGWLLQADLDDFARSLVPRLARKGWRRYAFAAELEHPRFGGSYESMLALVSEAYRRLAIEPVSLRNDDDGSAFTRLHAAPLESVTTGPLVSVILTCTDPGDETVAVARSVVAQTYTNWELIFSVEGPVGDADDTISQIEALDSRIRVVRNETNHGPFVRRNEAIQMAQGEFIAVQDADSWSHPHRLEVQVRDLVANPVQLANLVHGIRVTEDLSIVAAADAELSAIDSTLMFRRDPVVSMIGYYDSVLVGADREFRERLRVATHSNVPALVSEAPLVLQLVAEGHVPESPSTGLWVEPDRMAYTSAFRRFAHKIDDDAQDPHIPFPQDTRAFDAPISWRVERPQHQDFDVLVVVDGRPLSTRTDFLRHVVDELRSAVDAGLRVAIAQSDSIMGPRALVHITDDVQDMVNAGEVTRISPHDDIRAAVAVVRNAGAAQGQRAERWAASVGRAVVVQDPAATDVRGRTFARTDVADTVTAWFGVKPTWVSALPALPSPSVTAVAINAEDVRVTLTSATATRVRSVRLRNETSTIDLSPDVVGSDTIVVRGSASELRGKDWVIEAESDAGGGDSVVQRCSVPSEAIIWNHADDVVIRTDSGELRVLPRVDSTDLPATREFAARQLSANVERARVANDRLEVTVLAPTGTLIAVYALREVDGGVVRRRDFTSAKSTDGVTTWQRPLSKFTDARWNLFGTFRTSLGRVEFPISLDAGSVRIEGTEDWRPQILSGGRLLVASPEPSKATLARRRLARAVDLTSVVRGRSRATPQRSHLGPQYGQPRRKSVPVVSVVMPVYNVEPFLDEAISSVLDQDFSDLELIIVDDASTDNSRMIIERFWKKDTRVRVFALDHNTLGGAGMPSNIGMRAARGTYVAFADSDDHVSKTGLAKLVESAETHSADLAIGDFRTFSDAMQDGSEAYDRAVWEDLPLNTSISAAENPALFRLSPVPWRKLYRRDFLQKHGIQYPEGDYFYEDNPLHWFVLARAQRVVLCDEVISFHRMEREGQTMSAQTYKLGAFVNHANTIFNFLDQSRGNGRDSLFESFFGFLDRTHWTATKQTQPAAGDLVRRGFGDVYHRALAAAPTAPVPARSRTRLEASAAAYPDVDLTIVIPVFNSSDLLRRTLDSVLSLRGVMFNVLLVDDGSTDNSLELMQEYEVRHSNVHVFAQGNRGAGRARNSVIPLCTGRYTYFLDADDLVDPRSLAAAVRQADAESADLLFMKYRIEYVDEGRSRGVFDADLKLWEKLPQAASNADRQRVFAQLINYPWNRIIRTSLLHDANIFFGATAVHNDVLFHWHSITSAQHIGYIDVEVCTHRKFGARKQVTNVSDERRMVVLDALRSTHERISQLDSYPVVEAEWRAFTLHLLDWAKDRVPESLQAAYRERSKEIVTAFEGVRVSAPGRR
ncbi:glycosyltransferase [uncultured Microbacterium sp.]|uniref:glycosyltransferase family 2 protein n=1 Tax=uncultured Microbacterium sp. TaxID=191216 RepID=UPI0025939048|nr:glycosyltransferase [uncultured Microbacterium sp.]